MERWDKIDAFRFLCISLNPRGIYAVGHVRKHLVDFVVDIIV